MRYRIEYFWYWLKHRLTCFWCYPGHLTGVSRNQRGENTGGFAFLCVFALIGLIIVGYLIGYALRGE